MLKRREARPAGHASTGLMNERLPEILPAEERCPDPRWWARGAICPRCAADNGVAVGALLAAPHLSQTTAVGSTEVDEFGPGGCLEAFERTANRRTGMPGDHVWPTCPSRVTHRGAKRRDRGFQLTRAPRVRLLLFLSLRRAVDVRSRTARSVPRAASDRTPARAATQPAFKAQSRRVHVGVSRD
jgi:hypothetical protein